MNLGLLRRLLPNRAVPIRVWCGPFRGASIVAKPRDSLRKVFGLYEHELNAWLEKALARVDRVIDVGANDGYFTFGCLAAFRRLRKSGAIAAIESQDQHVEQLYQGLRLQPDGAQVEIIHALAGAVAGDRVVTLDRLSGRFSTDKPRVNTLIKIDVEGAETDVIEGASSWINPANLFLIEIHDDGFIDRIRSKFAERALRLQDVTQRPLPIVGSELRQQNNRWLVSVFR